MSRSGHQRLVQATSGIERSREVLTVYSGNTTLSFSDRVRFLA